LSMVAMLFYFRSTELAQSHMLADHALIMIGMPCSGLWKYQSSTANKSVFKPLTRALFRLLFRHLTQRQCLRHLDSIR